MKLATAKISIACALVGLGGLVLAQGLQVKPVPLPDDVADACYRAGQALGVPVYISDGECRVVAGQRNKVIPLSLLIRMLDAKLGKGA